jgi:serine/threonine protein kinase
VLQEWVPGGELFHHLDIEGSFSDAAACFYAANVLLALECLHARGIVYRDLKPENLLLDYKVCLLAEPSCLWRQHLFAHNM